MADTLVIVESPAKAKTIGKYLGSKYIVRASMGHVRDLPKSEMGVAVDDGFSPKYITIRGKGDVIKGLKEARKKVKRVFLAADPDREGEAIAWHLAHYLSIPEQEPCRVVFHEITKSAIQEAFKHPRPINMDLVNAQQARRILDRLVGYNISPLLWKKVKKGLSAGRVQSVAVKLIFEREKEIQMFIPEEYWTIEARLSVDGEPFLAKFWTIDGEKRKLTSHADVQVIVQRMQTKTLTVLEVVAKQRQRQPLPPFTTSTLQQEASRKLGFRAMKTMMIAQQLYEGIELGKSGSTGLITYLRTDSTRIAPTAQEEARAFIAETYGASYVPDAPRNYSKKNANTQDAHEAIRPTTMQHPPSTLKPVLSRDQLRLYQLIWDRFVASQMTAAIFDTVTADVGKEGIVFRANGSRLHFPGFLKVYAIDEESDATMLPALTVDREATIEGIDPKQHFTQPPPRYTESSLVKELEELGIGRPSTYAPTMETIKKRGYVAIEEKKFVPTELGELIIGQMEQYFPEILNYEFTANMEQHLDYIGDGSEAWGAVLHEFYQTLVQRLEVAQEEMKQVVVKEEETGEPCDLCGKPMVFKMGRFGRFVACSGFPDCRNAKPIMRLIGVPCPKCKEGVLVERRSKKGRIFYGCNTYPACDFSSWEMPLAHPCSKCGGMLVRKVIRKQAYQQCTSCHDRQPLEATEEREATS